MIRYSFTLVIWVCTIVIVLSVQCNRKPEGITPFWSNPNDKINLEILGEPDGYIPKEKYIVKLVSQGVPFTEFLLTVENENGDMIYPNSISSPVGKIDLDDDVLTKFSDSCPNAIVQTNDLPKMEIKVFWTAPDSQSGCIYFKATVVESPRVWYTDGSLIKKICEANDDGESLPSILEHCCACPEAKYEVTFEGLWSRNTHPKDFPEDKWSTKFSDVIGASHSTDYSFWDYDELANDGLKQLAENGNTRELEKELKDNSRHIRTIIKARGISYPNITGKTFAVFRVDNVHHLISLVSMIFPSPDWFVGVSNLELCLSNCSWVESKVLNLYPVDAGINDGITYMDRDKPSIPPQPIHQLKSNSPNFHESPFYDESGEPVKPFARIYLSRQRLYEKNCSNKNEEPKPNCELGPWLDWEPCPVTCGKGVQYRQRILYSNNREECKPLLTMRRICPETEISCSRRSTSMINEPNIDPICELTDWGNWSSCSETCGKGTMTRSRRYKNRLAAKRCAAGLERPPVLEQNIECKGEGTDCPDDLPTYDDCPEIPWSDWSPCLTFCGKGLKVRQRIFDSNVIENIDSDSLKDSCANIKRVETVECVHEEWPICSSSTSQEPKLVCNMPKDEGPCKSNIARWYFNSITEKCDIFRYSGCQGNENNFVSQELCEKVCGEYQKELVYNRTNKKLQLGASVSSVVSYGMLLQNDAPYVPMTSSEAHTLAEDCELSPWSKWSECETETSCGMGMKFKTRNIIKYPSGDGKECGDLMKTKTCWIECPENDQKYHKRARNRRKKHMEIKEQLLNNENLCEMSQWSPWSPCSQTCGSSAVQERTRRILRRKVANGIPCSERKQKRNCYLPICE